MAAVNNSGRSAVALFDRIPDDEKFNGDNFDAKEWLGKMERKYYAQVRDYNEFTYVFEMILIAGPLNWLMTVLNDERMTFPWKLESEEFIIVKAGQGVKHTETSLTASLGTDHYVDDCKVDADGVCVRHRSTRDLFLEKFAKKKKKHNCLDFFKGAKQHHGESVLDYEMEFIRLRREWAKGRTYELPEKFFMDVFEHNLLPDLRRALIMHRQKDEESLDELIEQVKELESRIELIDGGEEESKGEMHVLVDQTPTSDNTSMTRAQHFMDTRPGRSKRFCLYCLEEGNHTTFSCEALNQHQKNQEEKVTNSHTFYSLSLFSAFTSSYRDGEGKRVLPGLVEMQIGDVTYSALLDSGANLSLVHRSLVAEHGWKVAPTQGYVNSLGGPIPLMGKVREEVEIEGRKIVIDAYVVNKMGDGFVAILGGDMIEVSIRKNLDQPQIVNEQSQNVDVDSQPIVNPTSHTLSSPLRQDVGREESKSNASGWRGMDEVKDGLEGMEDVDECSLEVNGMEIVFGEVNVLSQKQQSMPNKFHDYECFKGFNGATVRMDPVTIDTGDSTPCSVPLQRWNPFQLKKLKKLINDALLMGIIEPCEAKGWSSKVRMVDKPDGSDRFTLALMDVNDRVIKDAYKPPNMSELRWKVKGARRFAKLDLSKAFFQVALEEGARDVTCFQTPWGTFRFKVMPMGFKNSTAEFQKRIDVPLLDIEGCMAYIDDILIWGESLEQLEARVDEVLKRLSAWGFRLNLDKCYYGLEQVDFLGFSLDGNSAKQTDSRLEAIKNLPYPKDKQQLASVLGIFQHLKEFVGPKFNVYSDRLSQLAKEIVGDLSKDERIRWTIDLIRDAILLNVELIHPNWEMGWLVRVDSCYDGVGAVLYNINDDGKAFPISFFSKGLPKSFVKKGITYVEAYGVKLAIEKFAPYLRGYEFKVQTDHKALEALNKGEFGNARVEEWFFDLMDTFSFVIEYCPGSQMKEVDGLSRLVMGECYVSLGDDIDWAGAQDGDERINRMVRWVKGDRDEFDDKESKKLASQTKDMELRGGVLALQPHKNGEWRVVVPYIYRAPLIESVHEKSHMGAGKILAALKNRFHWTNIRNDVYSYVGGCFDCAFGKNGGMKNAQRKSAWMPKRGPRLRLSVDNLELPTYKGKRYLLTIQDSFSKLGDAEPSSSVSSASAISALTKWIKLLGVPEQIVVDKGKAFVSREFRNWASKRDIEIVEGVQYHSEDNGQVERFNETIQDRLRAIMEASSSRNWPSMVEDVIRDYNSSVHETTKESPDHVVFGDRASWGSAQTVKTKVLKEVDRLRDVSRSEVKAALNLKAEKMKKPQSYKREFKVGDRVVTRKVGLGAKLDRRFAYPGKIIKVNPSSSTQPISFQIRLANGRHTQRHIKDLKHVRRINFDENYDEKDEMDERNVIDDEMNEIDDNKENDETEVEEVKELEETFNTPMKRVICHEDRTPPRSSPTPSSAWKVVTHQKTPLRRSIRIQQQREDQTKK